MKTFQHLILATITLIGLPSIAGATEPTAAQMKAVQECAAKQGVTLPAPPPDGGKPPQGDAGQQGTGNDRPPPPPKDGDQRQGPPKLTEAQRAVLDACFKQNGLTPPQPPEHNR